MSDLFQCSVREISEKLKKKEISSVELTQKSLEQIHKTEPQAEAFLKRLHRRRKRTRYWQPEHHSRS